MKLDIDLPDDLLREAMAVATRERTTVDALIREALQSMLTTLQARDARGREDLSAGGDGLQPGVAEGGWDAVRDEIYRDRGV